ncbi:hypothetical protein DFP73DRAFT_585936 [Morchella snyderi]|nr:hypothetical protein DFP73DRAFT_585936 [Morchella snyderi]
MNPTFSKAPISTTFVFALTATEVPDPQYEFQTSHSRDQERSNSVEMVTIVTNITGVLVAILTLTLMGYKHWKKTKRDLLPLPTTATNHALPTKLDNSFLYIYFILVHIASRQSRDYRSTTSYTQRPALEINRRSRDLEHNLKRV